ncbi:hypothetical protein G3A_19770 [Bacillus sp. 17376]|uniref:Uncharacterized protein n=1 Tax=Mesobacillus boroniphilus JCM 21738 TaxID=1294265 RepID=W4RT07_9BACI|nr:hypothetical protein [Mesobacillus boroniphilus]ESU30904.1 hypothetical protein G3A_19770 [Bacillus sp. 17376]GAE47421.1 hypothetical protein JCM21738_4404 [Mesobacillus boroniphilus JCM 21738]
MSFNNGAGNSGSGVGGGLFPAYGMNNRDQENQVKLNEDKYDVFVNDDFVGQKSLKDQGENLSDIDDFLRQQGISDFTASLDGDHYKIKTDGSNAEIAGALNVYFNNR